MRPKIEIRASDVPVEMAKLPWWTPNRTELTLLAGIVTMQSVILDKLANLEALVLADLHDGEPPAWYRESGAKP